MKAKKIKRKRRSPEETGADHLKKLRTWVEYLGEPLDEYGDRYALAQIEDKYYKKIKDRIKRGQNSDEITKSLWIIPPETVLECLGLGLENPTIQKLVLKGYRFSKTIGIYIEDASYIRNDTKYRHVFIYIVTSDEQNPLEIYLYPKSWRDAEKKLSSALSSAEE